MFARVLPNLFTVGNLFLGIMAILLAMNNHWEYAAITVIIGMLLDGLDGRVARMLNTQSEFGKELDSLSDVITFGVAPAIIMYVSVLKHFGTEGWFITAIFPICGALRLARFNVQSSPKGYFIGLPITAAGGILATMALYDKYVDSHYIMVIGMLFLSFLMVSQIKYPAFKKMKAPKAFIWISSIFIVAIAISAIFYPAQLPMVIFVPLALYALYGLKKSLNRRRAEKNEEPVED
ncbi:CDP-diacylglycerol--serine O-phosphatidyltransferase [Shimazuella alba]|jgi:CDP-diacylglycerol--serine O-phosphatidyltransferase|uniref:CDP-diacylglycerol--serine O-phosphatidyltransferase n=1 Tax=Shimazuella alba TaxID=2690964 RepID=A0A6I4VXC1_9BACL|nr:CDP-diacylglycerol--serine O-phosphatidyltransferase [Shimazuella alba]MXQ54580.1 CDP-diacylglycerol--serine O-phosphatidyltransferase [Shimazuella alba]